MALFEIKLPPLKPGDASSTLELERKHWVTALKDALNQRGSDLEPGFFCRIEQNGWMHIRDPHRALTYCIREKLDDEEDFEEPSAVIDLSKLSEVLEEEEDPPDPSSNDPLIQSVLEKIQWIYQSHRSFVEVSQALLELAQHFIPSEAGCILYPSIQGETLRFGAHFGLANNDLSHLVIPGDRGLTSTCIREGVSMIADRLKGVPEFHRSLGNVLDFSVKTMLCAPLRYEYRIFGAVALFNRQKQPLFSYKDLKILIRMGSQLAQYVALQL